jgi:hypothetical protein
MICVLAKFFETAPPLFAESAGQKVKDLLASEKEVQTPLDPPLVVMVVVVGVGVGRGSCRSPLGSP